LRSPDDP